MSERKTVCGISLALLLTISIAFGVVVPAEAQFTSIEVINPAVGNGNFIFFTSTTKVGDRFNATMWISDVVNLFAFQIHLTINDTLLNITRAWIPNWDSRYVFFGLPTVMPQPIFFDDDGDGSREAVSVGDVLVNGPGVTFSGRRLAAIVEFEILYEPTVQEPIVWDYLNINNFDTYLLDDTIAEIPALKVNGYYEYNSVHDVAITNVISNKTVVGDSLFAIIIVTVENQGDFTETFNVTAFYNETPIPTREQWPNLTQSEAFWSMGDVNRDGYVEYMDAHLIAAAAGSTPGQQCWDPDADLNGDGKVDIFDAMICAGNLGRDIWSYYGIPGEMQDQTVVTLPSGNLTTVTYRWNTTGLSRAYYAISANASQVPGEMDLVDNNFLDGFVTVASIGNIAPGPRPDNKVDIRDLATIAKAYGSYPCACYPQWNPNADITGPTLGLPDYAVDIRDLAAAALHFGHVEPP